MIIYSVMPPELIFEGFPGNYNWYETSIDGIKVILEPVGNSTARVVRLLSTNPEDYLNPRFQPGNLIDYLLD